MSEDLTDEEQVERLKNWWTENGVFFVSAGGFSVSGALLDFLLRLGFLAGGCWS